MADAERTTFTIQDFINWGRRGGQARAKLPKEKLQAIARKGVKARQKSRAASLKAKV